MRTTSSVSTRTFVAGRHADQSGDQLGARILNGVVVLLAGWLLVSPLTAGYAATDAANDVELAQIAAGVGIAVTALPRVGEPAAHPWLTLGTAGSALLLFVFPWLTGVAVNHEGPGLPPGAADNGFAPFASANAMVTSGVVLVLTALAWAKTGPRRPTKWSPEEES